MLSQLFMDTSTRDIRSLRSALANFYLHMAPALLVDNVCTVDFHNLHRPKLNCILPPDTVKSLCMCKLLHVNRRCSAYAQKYDRTCLLIRNGWELPKRPQLQLKPELQQISLPNLLLGECTNTNSPNSKVILKSTSTLIYIQPAQRLR